MDSQYTYTDIFFDNGGWVGEGPKSKHVKTHARLFYHVASLRSSQGGGRVSSHKLFYAFCFRLHPNKKTMKAKQRTQHTHIFETILT